MFGDIKVRFYDKCKVVNKVHVVTISTLSNADGTQLFRVNLEWIQHYKYV